VVPEEIESIEYAVNKLLPLVEPYGLTEEILRLRLSKKNDIYEPLVHKITDDEFGKFEELDIAGLDWEEETWRYYPEGNTLSHLTGFIGMQNEVRVGQYGLEGYFEDELSGEAGLIEGKTDITGRLIQTDELRRTDPKSGADLVLTIDRTLQAFVCQALEDKIKVVEATSGSVTIVDPTTGAVLAMCSLPNFDPNTYGEVEDIGVYLNTVVAATYEPGSIFKPFTMAAGLNEEVVYADTTYVDEGVEEIGKYKIRNSDGKAHGEVDMVTVLDESLNTGAIFVQRELGKDEFVNYVEKFGFGRTSDIELGNELAGNISSLYKRGDIFAATGSFGQGITATPIQLVMAYAAIANGGTLMKPYVIREKIKGDKTLITEPTLVDEVLSVRAATIVSGMLVSVIRSGHAIHAGVDGYYIAGKTGTAQVAEAGEYGEQTIHSFAGFGPVDDPVFAMLVKLDNPQIGIFSASTAAPLFSEIAGFIMQYYGVPPDEEI
jgi:cell division protein FtsI/penicillin-binding protein 2